MCVCKHDGVVVGGFLGTWGKMGIGSAFWVIVATGQKALQV